MPAAAVLAKVQTLHELLEGGDPNSDRKELYWPVWRFGQVLKPVSSTGLTVPEAQEIGELFEETKGHPGRAARRYRSEHMLQVQDAVARQGGHARFAGPEFDALNDALPAPLRRSDLTSSIRVGYQFVPIVRFPRFFVELDGRNWLVREGITVCGNPAKSKTWLAFSLVSQRGQSLESNAISLRDLTAIRRQLAVLRDELNSLLTTYYQSVLAEDVPQEPIEVSPILDLELTRSIEIVGMLGNGVEHALEAVDEIGLVAALEQQQALGRSLFADFLSWCARFEPASASTRPRSPEDPMTNPGYKMVDIYPEEALFDPARFLVTPKSFQSGAVDSSWYGMLAPRDASPVRSSITELATTYLAEEIGRSY